MAGSFQQTILTKLLSTSDTSGFRKHTLAAKNLQKTLGGLQKQLQSARNAQQQFQKASMQDIRTGRSAFGKRQGRLLQGGNKALQEAQQMAAGANQGLRRYKSTVNDAGERIMQFQGSQQKMNEIHQKAQQRAKGSERAFGKMFGVGMNLMFMGMALQKMFGGLTKSMLKLTGASTAMGAAAKVVLLPFFLAITPLIVKMSEALINLSKPVKMVAGAFVFLMTVMATLLFFGAQVGIMAATLSVSFATLTASMALVVGAVAAISIGLAGLVFLFQEGTRALGAFMVAVAVAIGALQVFGVRAAFSRGMLGPLQGAITRTMGALKDLAGTLKLGAAKQKLFNLVTSRTKGSAAATTGILGVLSGAIMTVSGAAKTAAASLGLTTVATKVYNAAALVASTITSGLAASFGALNLSLTGVLLAVGTLVLGILFLNRIFKKFGPVVGFLATVIGTVLLAALMPVVAAVLAIFGAFKAVNMIFKKFGEIVGVVAAVIVGIIAVLIGVFVSVPVAIGLAIGAVIAVIWNFKDEIWSALTKSADIVRDFAEDSIKFLKDLWRDGSRFVRKLLTDVVRFFKSIPRRVNSTVKSFVQKVKGFFGDMRSKASNIVNDIVGFFRGLGGDILRAAAGIGSDLFSLGEEIVEGLVDGIRSLDDAIVDALSDIVPDELKDTLDKAGGVGEDIANAINVNDFILTGNGELIQPAANDTIVGFNGNGPIQPGAGGGEVTVNINDPVMKEDIDVQRLVDEVEDRVNRDTRGRTGGL